MERASFGGQATVMKHNGTSLADLLHDFREKAAHANVFGIP
jgi:hypothetical protein